MRSVLVSVALVVTILAGLVVITSWREGDCRRLGGTMYWVSALCLSRDGRVLR